MKRISIFFFFVLLFSGVGVMAQSACSGLKNPANFLGWYGKRGRRITGASTTTTIYNTSSRADSTKIAFMRMPTIVTVGSCGSNCAQGSAPDNNRNRFQIITQQGGDAHTGGNLPRIPPQRSTSIRLGDMCSASLQSAEAIFYEVDVTADNALVFIDYACVMEAPTHGATGNPEFIIRVCRQTNPATDTWATTPISDSLCYIVQAPNGTSNLPTGWSSHSASGCPFVYKPWTKVAINLYKYLYQKVRIEMYISDCTAEFHGAYAYISGTCQPMRLEANGCAAGETEDVATIKAPSGLSSYQWYRSRNGYLTGTASTDPNNYVPIANATDSILSVVTAHLTTSNGDTVAHQSFMCEMISYMDPTKPIKSQLYTDVMNKKPKLTLDTILTCTSSVTLIDHSQAPIVEDADDNVDTSLTVWEFYDARDTMGAPVHTHVGGKATWTYSEAGMYAVTVRTSARDTSCWNKKTVLVRAIAPPQYPGFEFERNDLCFRDTIGLTDTTVDSDWRMWRIHHRNGTVDTLPDTSRTIFTSFDSTELVEIIVGGRPAHVVDTTGQRVTVICKNVFSDTIRVGTYPILVVEGDTIVCIGSTGDITVRATNVEGCTFEWFDAMGSSAPFSSNSHITVSPRRSTWYYVKVTTHPNECFTWDSIFVRVVDPTLDIDKTQICVGDTVMLTATNAFSYSWSANPQDPDLEQWNNDSVTHPVIYVTPKVTTTYTMVGHGSNGCNSNPLSKTVTVYPYPIPKVDYTPNFVDSEEPTVTFHDLSQNGVRSLWNFGDGSTSTMRDATYSFTDISRDSVCITLFSFNTLGCVSDTTFCLPVVLFSAWLPNTFTPALGGENSFFRIYSGNILEHFSMYIYDRAGRIVYRSHDQYEGWNGTNLNGDDCLEGIYVYVCSYRRPNTTDITTRKGAILLIR